MNIVCYSVLYKIG